MTMPKEIEQNQKDYKEDAWKDYSEEEYSWWVRLFTKRATMRALEDKKVKDLIDARNYLLMWLTKYNK